MSKRQRHNPRDDSALLVVLLAAAGVGGYLYWQKQKPQFWVAPKILGSGVGVGGGSSSSANAQGVLGDYGKIGGLGY